MADPPTPAQKWVQQTRVLVIAHRGFSAEAPENTLPAFQKALDVGADLVELDYHHSSDGVPVVIHDSLLARTTDSFEKFLSDKLTVKDKTAAELQTLDVGGWFDASFAGTKLPTLEASLRLIQTKSVTLVEHKHGDAKTLVKLLDAMKLTDEVVVQSFDWKFIADCQREQPRLVLAALGGEPLNDRRLAELAKLNVPIVVWNHGKLGKEQVAALNKQGQTVWSYTINDAKEAKRLLSIGVKGIITDNPSKIIPVRDAFATAGSNQ